MKTIWKFELNIQANPWLGKIHEIDIPKFSKIVGADIDGKSGNFCIWALVNPEHESEKRRFVIYGTGQEIAHANELIHLNTVQQGPYVWHIFELNLPGIPQ